MKVTKFVTIVGARPQFIKASVISRETQSNPEEFDEILVHTGQHFDDKMSADFFKELELNSPKYNLGHSGLSHGEMTGRMIESIEQVLIIEKPKFVLVYGDTNSTLAGALAATKLFIPVFHVEAGLRSHNFYMPEEINRVLTDNVSSVLFCPTHESIKNLHAEGMPHNCVYLKEQVIAHCGDVMLDSKIFFSEHKSFGFDQISNHKPLLLCTIHRQENITKSKILKEILQALIKLKSNFFIIFPIHPATMKAIKKFKFENYLNKLNFCEPLSYFEIQNILSNAKHVITDSGGVQKEAYFHGVTCSTIRYETEWSQTLKNKNNILVEPIVDEIVNSCKDRLFLRKDDDLLEFGQGKSGKFILDCIRDCFV
tara:strand:- start:369 stop:1475 length:1107 start_codon:yes stop_codon:yes gene_type:complete